MASSGVCTSCLRAMRQQAQQRVGQRIPKQNTLRLLAKHQSDASRAFTTSQSYLAKEHAKPLPQQSPASSPPSQPPPLPKGKSPNAIKSIAATMRNSPLRSTTEPYVAYGGTEALFRICAAQCDYTIPSVLKQPPEPAPQNAAREDVGEGTGWWFQPKTKGGLGLSVTFSSWAQVMFLHMYVLTVRMRMFDPKQAGVWHQQLLDHFFYAAEDRMAVWHGMSARGVRNKNLKDLFLQWRGVLLSYDEGLIKGDDFLAAAVWRNLFKSDENASISDIALVTSYLRHQLQLLDRTDDGDIAGARIRFSSPAAETAVVSKESKSMNAPFTAEDLKMVQPKEP